MSMQAAIREVYEELGVSIQLIHCYKTIYYHGKQVYFLARITDGTFGSGKGEEFSDKNRRRGTYEPMWIDLKEINDLDVRPFEIAEEIYVLSKKNGFSSLDASALQKAEDNK